MNPRRVVSTMLQLIGVVALLVAGIVFCLWNYGHPASAPSGHDAAFAKKDLVAAINWAGADPSQDGSIISSSRSARGFSGGHSDYACIQLDHFDNSSTSSNKDWATAPETDPLLIEALDDAIRWAVQAGAKCVPDRALVNSTAVERNFWHVVIGGRSVTAAIVFLYEPATRRLFYFDFKT